MTLEPPDSFHLSAASGWVDLGALREARAEMARIGAEFGDHPDVLEVWWTIHAAEKDWKQALEAARRLVALNPERASGCLHLAYALRRVPGGGIQAAWEFLLPWADRFPGEAVIAYNLACYACQMGRLDLAREWLARAMKRGRKDQIRSMALKDEDLRPLWPEMDPKSD